LKFEKFWSLLHTNISKRKFRTLKLKKEFKAWFRDDNAIIVTPKSTKNPKIITKNQMKKA